MDQAGSGKGNRSGGPVSWNPEPPPGADNAASSAVAGSAWALGPPNRVRGQVILWGQAHCEV